MSMPFSPFIAGAAIGTAAVLLFKSKPAKRAAKQAAEAVSSGAKSVKSAVGGAKERKSTKASTSEQETK